MIEKIKYEDKVLALILRRDYPVDGVSFITAEDEPIQLGVLKHQRGIRIKPHIHKNQPRTISEVQEVLYSIRSLAYGLASLRILEQPALLGEFPFEADQHSG